MDYEIPPEAPDLCRPGVREAWVVYARTLGTRVFRLIGPRGYNSARSKAHGRRLEPEHAPELAVSLADLGLAPLD